MTQAFEAFSNCDKSPTQNKESLTPRELKQLQNVSSLFQTTEARQTVNTSMGIRAASGARVASGVRKPPKPNGQTGQNCARKQLSHSVVNFKEFIKRSGSPHEETKDNEHIGASRRREYNSGQQSRRIAPTNSERGDSCGFSGSISNNRRSSYSPLERKKETTTSQFSLAHEPENFRVEEPSRRDGSQARRDHIIASMKIAGFNSQNFKDRYMESKLKKANAMAPFVEESYGAIQKHKKKYDTILAEEKNRSSQLKRTLAHQRSRQNLHTTTFGDRDDSQSRSSIDRSHREASSSQTYRKNKSTFSIGHGAPDIQLTNQYRASKKNVESTGDYDIDRRPHAKQFSKKSTANLLVASHQEQLCYMKILQRKHKLGPKKNIESYGPITNLQPLTDQEQPRSRPVSKNQMYDVLTHDNSLADDRNRSRSKCGQSSLFRSGSSLSNTRETQKSLVQISKGGNMKGAVVMGFGDSVRAENQKRVGLEAAYLENTKTSRPAMKSIANASQFNLDEIMKNLDCKITKLEKLNMRVQKLNELNQKDKHRLQEHEGDDVSIVSQMTGDPREIVHSKREGLRHKSRTDAEKSTRNSNMNQELRKNKMQSGSKNYLPFQDQEKLRKGIKIELLKRNNDYLQRQMADRVKLTTRNKKHVDQKILHRTSISNSRA